MDMVLLHNCVNKVNMCNFYLGEGGGGAQNWKNKLVMDWPKWPITKQKKIELWDALQLIKLINISHNRYPSFCKS
jgi:hypothetical protein